MTAWPDKPTSKHYLQSDCGQFRISRCAVRRDTKIVLQYRLWEKGDGKWSPLGTFNSAAEARESLK